MSVVLIVYKITFELTIHLQMDKVLIFITSIDFQLFAKQLSAMFLSLSGSNLSTVTFFRNSYRNPGKYKKQIQFNNQLSTGSIQY